MDRLNYRRLLWALHRSHLRHGPVLWVAWLAVASVVVLALAVLGSALRLDRLDTELAQARVQATRTLPAVAAADRADGALPLPPLAARFEINQRMFKALDDSGLSPGEIRFKFEHAEDAGLTRQIAAFSVSTRWSSIAGLLDTLQRADRSIYIARLKVARQRPSDDTVDADLQLGAVLRDDGAAAGATP